MGRSCSIANARNHFPRIVHEVERGGRVELSRRGRSVAILLSIEEFRRLTGRDGGFARAVDRFLHDMPEARGAIRRDFLRGVRDRSPGRKVAL